jgi:two-component system nitrate/nitrite response regulator NarL
VDVVVAARVLIVGSVRLYRDGLADALAGTVDVVGTAAAGPDALERVAGSAPDVVIVDLMHGGVRLITELSELVPAVRVVALAVRDSEDEVLACAEAGIAGYVTREASFDELAETLESVARGETVCSPRIAAALLRRVASLARAEPARAIGGDLLTRREVEVLELVDRGFSNKEIGLALHIELPTVKNHVHHILEKLQVPGRSDAAARFRAARSRTA